jgi:hypothetical protein
MTGREPTHACTSRLQCVECGREQTAGEHGWKAYLTTDEDEPAEAVVYCPECTADEFDTPPGQPLRIWSVRRAASVCGAPGCPNVAGPLPWRDPGRKVQDCRSTSRPRARPQPDRTSRVASAPERRPRALCAKERNRRLAEDAVPAGHQEAHAAPPTDSRIVMCAQGGWLAPRRAPSAIPSATTVGTVDGHLIRRRALCPPTRAASAPLRTTSHR